MRKVIFVIGRIASGKSTYVKSIQQPQDLVIELGQIVRDVKGTNDRVFDGSMDEVIAKVVKEEIGRTQHLTGNIILVAPRSLSLVKTLISIFDNEMPIEYHLLEVPQNICKHRYETAGREKDQKLAYKEAIAGDKKIGMEELIGWLYDNEYDINLIRIPNYEESEFVLSNSVSDFFCPRCQEMGIYLNQMDKADFTRKTSDMCKGVVKMFKCPICGRVYDIHTKQGEG